MTKLLQKFSHYIIGASFDSSMCFFICIILICLCIYHLVKFMERRKRGYSGLKKIKTWEKKKIKIQPVIYIHRISDVHVYKPACAYSSQSPKKEDLIFLELISTQALLFCTIEADFLSTQNCIWADLMELGYISPTDKTQYAHSGGLATFFS